jgi:RHS repeat-associated protein
VPAAALGTIFCRPVRRSIPQLPPSQNSNNIVLQQLYAPSTSGGGWQYGYDYQLWLEIRPVSPPPPDNGCPYAGAEQCAGWNYIINVYQPYCTSSFAMTFLNKFSIIFPDGSHHVLHMYGYKDDDYYEYGPNGQPYTGCPTYSPLTKAPPTGSITYYTVDGTYVRLVMNLSNSSWTNNSWTMYFPDGRTVAGTGFTPTTMSDKNGNTITLQNLIDCTDVCGPPTTVLSDAFGRSITLQSNLNNQDVITQTWFPASAADPSPGNTGTLTWTVNWETVAPSQSLTYPCWYGYDVSELSCNGAAGGGLFSRAVQSIVLPQPPDGSNLQYQFNYACPVGGGPSDQCNTTTWGQMSDITLPSLATVHYDFTPYGARGSTSLLTTYILDKTEIWNDENDSPPTQRQEQWGYSFFAFGCNCSKITNPDGGVTETDFYALASASDLLTNKIIFPDGSTSQKVWAQNVPYDPGSEDQRVSLLNPYLQMEFDTLPNGTQTRGKVYTYDQNGNEVGVNEYDWFPSSQLTTTTIPACGGFCTVVTGLSSTAPAAVRQTSDTYMYTTPNAQPQTEFLASLTADNSNAYWNPAAPALLDLTVRSVVTGTGPGSVTEYSYDNHGNLTEKRLWDSGVAPAQPASLNSGNALLMDTTYDQYGNVTDTYDAQHTDTHYDYDGNSLYLVDKIVANGTPLQETTTYSFEPNTGVMLQTTDPNNLTTAFGYDRYARLVTSKETSGSTLERVTTNLYEDFNRRIAVKTDLNAPNDQALQSVTDYDQLGRVRLTRQLECTTATASALNCAAQSIDDDTTGIKVQTRYQSVPATNGYSAKLVSNPYRGGSNGAPTSAESTMGWTLSASDQMGRVVSAASFSGPTLPAPWSGGNAATTGTVTTTYNQDTVPSTGTITSPSNQDTVRTTDQAGHARVSASDGLGRLVVVREDPDNLNYITQYAYDVLDSLTNATQMNASGNMSRNFSYDSLKRLTQAQNPESGTINYSYRVGGALCSGDASAVCSHTDARNYTTTMTYDVLNRVAGKSYNDGATPSVTYCYDGSTSAQGCTTAPAGSNMVGRLTMVQNVPPNSSTPVSTTTYASFDALGRITASAQQPGSNAAYDFTYAYNPAGGMTTIHYPTGEVVNYAYDGAGRPLSVQESGTGNTVYANNVQYAPQGALAQMTMHPDPSTGQGGLVENASYNDRLQMTSVSAGSLLSLSYDYGSSSAVNNGNLLTQTLNASGNVAVQSYTYDNLNRLKTATETPSSAGSVCAGGAGWCQQYVFDQFGNRSVLAGTAPTYVVASSNTPQVATDNPTALLGHFPNNQSDICTTYDLAGNATVCPFATAVNYTYDAENRLVAADTTSFAYGGDGRRVSKTQGSTTTMYVYDAAGQLAAEYSTTPATGGTTYLTADNLGSTRLLTDSNSNVIERHDYLPFGEDIPAGMGFRTTALGYLNQGAPDGLTERFTGKERDAETGLDYFGARYLSSAQGRWMSPDWSTRPDPMPYADPSNPQTLNLYGYVQNNPLSLIDDGHDTLSPKTSRTEDEQLVKDRLWALGQELIGAGKALSNVVKEFGPHPERSEPAEPENEAQDMGYAVVGGAVIAEMVVNAFTSQPSRPSEDSGPPAPTEAYDRQKHYGTTPTEADRKAVGGSPDHDPALVKRYYEGDPARGEKPGHQQTPGERKASAADGSRMKKSTLKKQRQQGAEMARYSKQKKKEYGLK